MDSAGIFSFEALLIEQVFVLRTSNFIVIALALFQKIRSVFFQLTHVLVYWETDAVHNHEVDKIVLTVVVLFLSAVNIFAK